MDNRPFSDFSFGQFLDEETLMSSRCQDCKEISTPQRSLCANCYSSSMEWIEMQGTGRLLAFSCIHIGAKFMAKKGFDRHNPYCVGVVELTEGTKINARIIGVDANNPETIKVGMDLRATYLHELEDEAEKTYLAFTPA